MSNVIKRLINRPRSLAPREWLFQIHLYTGLVAGLYALLIGVTGSALVFQPHMRDWLDRDLTRVQGSGPHVSIDQALASVRASHPGFQAMSVRVPVDARDTFRISSSHMGGHQVYVNPFNAAIVGEALPKDDLLAGLQQLHFNLLSGKTGRLVNGIGGLMMLSLGVTGIFIWWPGKSLVKRAVSIRRNGRWPRVNYDLHSAIGFFTTIFIVVISATGAYYAWPAETKDLVAWFSPLRQKTAEPHLAKRPEGKDLPLTQLLQTAREMVPGAWVSTVMLPHQPGQPVKVTLLSGAAREYEYSNYVYLDPWTGNVLRVDSVDDRSAGDAVLAWISPLHYGTFGGGVPVYILWMILGLSPVVLGVSGILMWWNRVAVKKIRKLRAAPVHKTAVDTKPESVYGREQVSRSA
jgi:uncharacterized iron-regulated membrane protein